MAGFTSRPLSFQGKYFLVPLDWRFDWNYRLFLSVGEEENSARPQYEFSSSATNRRGKTDTDKATSLSNRHDSNYYGTLPIPTTVVCGFPSPMWICGRLIILDFKIPPCCECCFLSCGWFPDAWNLCATFRNTLFRLHKYCEHDAGDSLKRKIVLTRPMKIERTEYSETSANKTQTSRNHPKGSVHVADALRV